MEQIVVFILEILVLVGGTVSLIKIRSFNKLLYNCGEIINNNSKIIDKIIILVTFVLSLLYIYNGHDWGDDFSAYLAQAIALVDNTMPEHEAVMHFIQENSIAGTYPVYCSWGLPIVLAILYRFFGFNLIVFRIFGAVCLTIFAYMVYRFLSKRMETKDTCIAILFIIACKHYMEAGTSILTDIPCAMFSMIAIYSLYELMNSDKKRQLFYSIIFGICSFAAYQFRSPGIVLILTFMCIQVIRFLSKKIDFIKKQVEKTIIKNISLQAHLAPYIIYIVGYFTVSATFPQAGNDYLSFIQYAPSNYVIWNIKYYLTILHDFFDVGNYLAIICGYVLLILIIIGIIVKFHEEIISLIFLMGTMAMLYLTPFVSSVRYLFYLYPFFLMYAYYGTSWLVKKLSVHIKKLDKKIISNIIRYCFTCVGLFMMVFSLRMIWKIHTKPLIDSAYAPEAMEAYEWIKQETNEDDIVLFFKPRALWLNTHRYGYNTYDDVNDIDRADYVFFFKKDNFNNLREYISEHNNEYVLKFSNDNFQIYMHIE